MENGWTERIAELTESRDHWKREWRLLNAGLNMAEDKIKELEAENKRLREALKGLLQEAIVLTDDYLSMFETYHDTHVIQGWDKARWVRVSQAARDAREALKEASHE